MNINASNTERAIYNKIAAQAKRKYPNAKPMKSYLRLEKSLQGTFTSISFDVLTNQGTPNVTERRLQITDRFVITHMALLLVKAGTTTAATDAEKAGAKLRANNNALVFTTAGEAAALQAIYNGFTEIKVDQTVYAPYIDNQLFYRVETSQKGVGPAVIITDDEWNDVNYGFAEIVPTITLSGASNNQITVNLPTSVTTSGTASQNFLVCYMRGLLVPNTSKLNPVAGSN